MLDNPLLGPLVRGALRVAAPNLDPAEVTPLSALGTCTCSDMGHESVPMVSGLSDPAGLGKKSLYMHQLLCTYAMSTLCMPQGGSPNALLFVCRAQHAGLCPGMPALGSAGRTSQYLACDADNNPCTPCDI